MASGSSIGVNSTLGNDLPSLTISDDFPADFFQDLDMSSVYGNCSLMKKKYVKYTNGFTIIFFVNFLIKFILSFSINFFAFVCVLLCGNDIIFSNKLEFVRFKFEEYLEY